MTKQILEDYLDEFPYLRASEGFWIDADGKNHAIDDMSPKYRKNCVKTIDRYLNGGLTHIKDDNIKIELKKHLKEKKNEIE